MTRQRAVAADLEHIGIDVADGGVEAQACRLGCTEGDVPGTAGDVEQGEGRIVFRRVQRIDHDVLPDPVQARRHQIVHQVVTGRHAVKYVVHQRLLVPQRHVPEAKMGGLIRLVHASALFFPVIASQRVARMRAPLARNDGFLLLSQAYFFA